MDNNALVAALGHMATGAVRGYRSGVVAAGAARGLRLVEEAGSARAPVDPIDIRLRIAASPLRHHRNGALWWSPATGWLFSTRHDGNSACYFAGPRATPRDLVPEPSDVADWAVTLGRSSVRRQPPPQVELDDEPKAIRRLLAFSRLQPTPVAPPGRLLHVDTALHGATPVVRPTGALDVSSAPVLAKQLRTWVRGCHHVVLDLSGVTFLSAAGIGALIEAHQLARARRGMLHVTGADHYPVRRVLAVTRADKILSMRRESAAALTARIVFAATS